MTTTQPPSPTPLGQTALMPLDPSPGYAMRVLPLRANLLPDEITSGRNARRIRTVLIFAIVLVIVGLGGWFAVMVAKRSAAQDDLAAVTSQVDLTRTKTRSKEYADVTATIDEADKISKQLTSVMANDLPWSTVFEALHGTGVRGITVTNIAGMLKQDNAGAAPATTPGTAVKKSVASLTIQGKAKDKGTIAAYLDAVAKVDGVTHVYLTVATAAEQNWTFSLNAEVSADRLCGRFTTNCPTGGK